MLFYPRNLWDECKTILHMNAYAILREYPILVYTTQVNSTFRARWLASSEVINQVLFTSEQSKKDKVAFVGTFSHIKLLFGLLVIQLNLLIIIHHSVSESGGYLPRRFAAWQK